MKINKLKQRLHKDHPMTTIGLRMPEDGVEDEVIASAMAEVQGEFLPGDNSLDG